MITELAAQTKIIYLLRGIPGSGKTSLAHAIARGTNATMLSADDFPNRYLPSGDLNPAHSIQEAHDWFKQELEKLIDKEVRAIVLHNTFVEMSSIFPIWMMAQDHGYLLQVIYCEALVLTDGTRAKSTKNVTESLIRKFKSKWQKYSLTE